MSLGTNHTIVNMVFCAYCGKSFTRKEHLERHIPSHTNVKPHRCTSCQLSFARRDLLQRHYSTYHEIRDPALPPPAIPTTIAGRTPIACLNCASAKTGCDKRVPCSRCADKSLPCAARFARRSSKLMARAIAASEASAEQAAERAEAVANPPKAVTTTPPAIADIPLDPRLQASPPVATPLSTPRMFEGETFGEHLGAKFEDFNEYMQFNDAMVSPGINYQDLLSWNDLSVDFDMYHNMPIIPSEHALQPTFSDPSDGSSHSDTSSASVTNSRSIPHTRSCSISSIGDQDVRDMMRQRQTKMSCCAVTPEFEEMLASETAWPLARCNPTTFSDSCPRTAVVHLESLEQNSRHEHAWDSLNTDLDQASIGSDLTTVEPLTLGTRDTLHAITQGFLHRALKTHRGGFTHLSKNQGYPSPGNFSFLVLPPTNILEYFLRNHARSLSSYYSLSAAMKTDPNELMHGNQAATLLVLLMIAQGATIAGSTEARCLSAGLTETCRISLFDIIERDIELCADPVVLRCALLFTLLGAWSGDKWHMDIVMGQRGMYLAMLKHAGMLEQQDTIVPTVSGATDSDAQWRIWVQQETRNRLVYNWVMVDQELSLFHDLSTILSISEIESPMPNPNERLWRAKDSREWTSILCEGQYAPQLPTSLHDLFQDFLHDNLSSPHSQLTPLKLRLLLHPIQSLLYQVRQILTCFSSSLSARHTPNRTVTKASTLMRLEEIQSLLQKWYNLNLPHVQAKPNCLITRTNLILYHLISLNAVTSFLEIERLARKERFDGSYWELSLRHKKCIYHSSEAVFHAGQVLRLISSLPVEAKPAWTPVALYRASLILWVDVLAKSDPSFPPQTASGPAVAINEAEPEAREVMSWLWGGEGMPVLKGRDGRIVKLRVPAEVLGFCAGLVREGPQGRLTDGILRKLRGLMERWHGIGGIS